jgi:leucyl-tRNA synthetase
MADAALLVNEEVLLVVQINGKVRARITVAVEASESAIEAAALADERLQSALAGVTPKKIIVVPGRMVSIVV